MNMQIFEISTKCGSGTGHAYFFAFRAIFRIAISQKLLQLQYDAQILNLNYSHTMLPACKIWRNLERVGVMPVLKWHEVTHM